jgi:hypothetical protein
MEKGKYEKIMRNITRFEGLGWGTIAGSDSNTFCCSVMKVKCISRSKILLQLQARSKTWK